MKTFLIIEHSQDVSESCKSRPEPAAELTDNVRPVSGDNRLRITVTDTFVVT